MDIERYSEILVNSKRIARNIDRFIDKNSEELGYAKQNVMDGIYQVLQLDKEDILTLRTYHELYGNDAKKDIANAYGFSKKAKRFLMDLFILSVFKNSLLFNAARAEFLSKDFAATQIVENVFLNLSFLSDQQSFSIKSTIAFVTKKILTSMETFDEIIFTEIDVERLFIQNDFLHMARNYLILFLNHIGFSIFRTILIQSGADREMLNYVFFIGPKSRKWNSEDKIKQFFLIKKYLNRNPNSLITLCRNSIRMFIDENIDASNGIFASYSIFNGALYNIFAEHPSILHKLAESLKFFVEKMIEDSMFFELDDEFDEFSVKKHLFNENVFDSDEEDDDMENFPDEWGWNEVKEKFSTGSDFKLKNPQDEEKIEQYFYRAYKDFYVKVSNSFIRTFAKFFVEELIEEAAVDNLERCASFLRSLEKFEKFLIFISKGDYLKLKFSDD